VNGLIAFLDRLSPEAKKALAYFEAKRPAEAVIELLYDFAPSGYGVSWVLERFGDQIPPNWFAELYGIKKTA
jgi:hypothetical protein